MRYLFAFAALILLSEAVPAEERFDAQARAKVVAPLFDEQTFALGHIDLTKVDADKLIDAFRNLVKMEEKEVAEARKNSAAWLKRFLDAGGQDLYVVFSTQDLLSDPMVPFFVIPLADNASDVDLGKALNFSNRITRSTIGKNLVVGAEATLTRLRTLKAVDRPELAKGFAMAGDTVAQFLVLPTPDNRKVIDGMLPKLPRAVGGGPTKPFTRGLEWAALGVNLPPHLSARLIVQSPDAETAKAFQKALEDLLKSIAANPYVKEYLPGFDPMSSALHPTLKDDRLSWDLQQKTIEELVGPIMAKMRVAAKRTESVNHLKQFALAMHNYHDTFGSFAPAYSSTKEGKPLLSWRVLILPFIAEESLYKEFHLDEPWDSEHNKKLIARMPALYGSPDRKPSKEGKTTYLTPRHKDTVFPGREGIKIKDITDGTSNTIMIVDAADDHAVIWTKPDDLNINPEKATEGLANVDDKGFLVALCDGSVRFISKTISAKNLWAWFTRAGGEVVKDE